ncbi:MAG: hypothetical protein MJY99_03625 [Fibrobacter sp.]|nr:hypothetical protein [Fibrobacter sp.]
MKFSHALLLACSFAFFACDDDSSSASSDENQESSTSTAKSSESSTKLDGSKVTYDCNVKDGVKVVYPAGGETFKMGDEITIIYGSDVQGSGYRFVFKTSEDDMGIDMFEGSEGPENPDGKTCYKQKVKLSDDFAEATDEAIIRVIPYEKQAKGANSATFKVKD